MRGILFPSLVLVMELMETSLLKGREETRQSPVPHNRLTYPTDYVGHGSLRVQTTEEGREGRVPIDEAPDEVSERGVRIGVRSTNTCCSPAARRANASSSANEACVRSSPGAESPACMVKDAVLE